jgi:predicted ATP-dependent endonuclease of OLD family
MALSSTPTRQVLCSTHSSHFVSKNAMNIPSLVRMKRVGGRVETCQISKADWDELVDANRAINTIAEKWPDMRAKLQADDLRPEMEAVKHFLWLNPDRCGMFFANHVLLVEGATEQALINKLIGERAIRNADCGLYVLDCMGKYNIHRFMNLASRLGIPHSVLHDDDFGDREHADMNELILSSRHATLTLEIQTIRGSVERLLGVTPAKSPHRKPQHVLFLHDTGRIDKENLAAFCALVEQCLPRASGSVTGERPEAPLLAGGGSATGNT